MSSSQGWFESDDDYRDRIAREADERAIESSTGSAPSQGWFESDADYRDRIAQEANEHRVEDSTGSAPSKGWFESDTDYRDRIAQEANERTIEDSTGAAPKQSWFESNDDYDTRIRKEANEHIIKNDCGSAPKQGWFESNHDYRSRIAHEARENRARERSHSASGTSDSTPPCDNDSTSYSGGSSSSVSSTGSDLGGALAFVILAVLAVVAFAAVYNSDTPSSSPQMTLRTEQPPPQTTTTTAPYVPYVALTSRPEPVSPSDPVTARESNRPSVLPPSIARDTLTPPPRVTYCARIRNRTGLVVPFRVWSDRGWEDFNVAPGRTWTMARTNTPVRISWDAAPHPRRAILRELTLDATRVVGRPPSDHERNTAPASYFNFLPNGEVGVFRN